MRLPPLKRLVKAELVGLAGWFEPVLVLLNNVFQVIWQSLDRNITLQDNIRCQIAEVGYIGGSAITLSTNLTSPIMGILILEVSGEGITAASMPIWKQVGQTIEISSITGLTAGNSYKVRLLLV